MHFHLPRSCETVETIGEGLARSLLHASLRRQWRPRHRPSIQHAGEFHCGVQQSQLLYSRIECCKDTDNSLTTRGMGGSKREEGAKYCNTPCPGNSNQYLGDGYVVSIFARRRMVENTQPTPLSLQRQRKTCLAANGYRWEWKLWRIYLALFAELYGRKNSN